MPPIEDNTENQHEETVSYTVSRKSLETIARCNSEKQVYTCTYIYIHKDGASSSHIQDGQTTSRHLDHTYCATYTALLLTVILARYSKHLVLYMKIPGDI